MFGKRFIKQLLLDHGYILSRVSENVPRRNAYEDIGKLLASIERPLVLDVGANVGQSIQCFRKILRKPRIHAFEPGEETFKILQGRMVWVPDVFLANLGLGSRREVRVFVQNSDSDMSSFLEPGPDCWGGVLKRSEIQLETVDGYCSAKGIKSVDILKSDTQGFDLEVFRGAEETLSVTRLVYVELLFSKMYEGSPRFDQVYAFLADRNFIPVSFYEMYYQNGLLSWTDALFANSNMLDTLRNTKSKA